MHPAVAVRAPRAGRRRDRLPDQGQRARGVRAAIEEARRGRRYIGRDTATMLGRWSTAVGRARRTTRCRTASIRCCACSAPARPSPTSRATGPERQDGEHVPHARPREARDADQRRADALRDRERVARVVNASARRSSVHSVARRRIGLTRSAVRLGETQGNASPGQEQRAPIGCRGPTSRGQRRDGAAEASTVRRPTPRPPPQAAADPQLAT